MATADLEMRSGRNGIAIEYFESALRLRPLSFDATLLKDPSLELGFPFDPTIKLVQGTAKVA